MTRVRREMGQDIAGACGQLALNEKAVEVGHFAAFCLGLKCFEAILGRYSSN